MISVIAIEPASDSEVLRPVVTQNVPTHPLRQQADSSRQYNENLIIGPRSPGPIYVSGCLSLSERRFVKLY